MGGAALLSNTGSENTATGCSALFSNINADNNTADGAFALFFNTTGDNNTAVGNRALESNIDGSGHTAVGSQTLFSNRHAGDNTAVGDSALFLDDSSGLGIGAHNTAVGNLALTSNIDGGLNTGIGDQALMNSTGTGNTALGASAGGAVTTANGVICIGSAGADVSNTAWIGNVFGVTTVSGTTAPVIVSDTGQLGTVVSSERFKKDINPMDRTSEDILSLRPVTFHYKSDAKGTPQFGLIAEEVAKVNPALVLPDKEGKPYTVRYDAVNAMLLNEFLKEHRKVQELEANDVQQQNAIKALTAMVKEQAAQIQKVSAQLELKKSCTENSSQRLVKLPIKILDTAAPSV
jgi:uncharacterized coiled-coil protein SlyX